MLRAQGSPNDITALFSLCFVFKTQKESNSYGDIDFRPWRAALDSSSVAERVNCKRWSLEWSTLLWGGGVGGVLLGEG